MFSGLLTGRAHQMTLITSSPHKLQILQSVIRIFSYLVMVGLFGGLAAKIEKSNDIGTWSLLLLFSSGPSLSFPWSPYLSLWWELPSNPSRSGMILLDFLGGDRTVGPSLELISETLGFTDSLFAAGRGSLSGFVGNGADVKYLEPKRKRTTEEISYIYLTFKGVTSKF